MTKRLYLVGLILYGLTGTLPATAESKQGIKVTETSRHGGPGATPDAVVYPVAVLVDAGWTKALIKQAIRKTESIFAQCGIVVTAGTIHWLDAPGSYHDLDETEQIALLEQAAPERPAAMFINQTTARDIAYSYLHSAPVPGRGTAWITRRADDSCAGPLLAHELGHILLDSSEHSSEPGNVMAASCRHSNIARARVNTRLSDSQCEQLRNRLGQ